MFAESDYRDPNQPHKVKRMIDGVEREVTVLPAGPEEHDETVWPVKRPSMSQQIKPYIYDGMGALQEYARTKADQGE